MLNSLGKLLEIYHCSFALLSLREIAWLAVSPSRRSVMQKGLSWVLLSWNPEGFDCCANLWMTMDMNIVLAARSLRDHLMESASIYLSGLKKSSGEYLDMNIVLAAYSWKDYPIESTYMFLSSLKNTTLYMAMAKWSHWKLRVDMMPTLSSLVALQVVIMTTCSATSVNKVSIMKSLLSVTLTLNLQNTSHPTMSCICVCYKVQYPDWELIFLWTLQCRYNEHEGVSIVYSTVCSGADQSKHQSFASLVNSLHKGPVMRKSIWWRHHEWFLHHSGDHWPWSITGLHCTWKEVLHQFMCQTAGIISQIIRSLGRTELIDIFPTSLHDTELAILQKGLYDQWDCLGYNIINKNNKQQNQEIYWWTLKKIS